MIYYWEKKSCQHQRPCKYTSCLVGKRIRTYDVINYASLRSCCSMTSQVMGNRLKTFLLIFLTSTILLCYLIPDFLFSIHMQISDQLITTLWHSLQAPVYRTAFWRRLQMPWSPKRRQAIIIHIIDRVVTTMSHKLDKVRTHLSRQ